MARPGSMTSADILQINQADKRLPIADEVIFSAPEMTTFAAEGQADNTYYSAAVTALPNVSFREPGAMSNESTFTLENRLHTLKFIDASWSVDTAVAEQNNKGKGESLNLAQETHLQSLFFTAAQQIWYGTNHDPTGFKGLKNLILDTSKIVNAGGTTNTSSVFFVRTAPGWCQIRWGSEGALTIGEIQRVPRFGTGTIRYDYAQGISGWMGFEYLNKHAVSVISGLDDSTHLLNDDLIFQALGTFPASMRPDYIFMNKRSLEQLRRSRVATNATGSPVDWSDAFISAGQPTPIIVTDAIVTNEETL